MASVRGNIVGSVSDAEGAPAMRERRGAPVRHRLEDFVVGDCNRLAYSAALRMADGGASSYGVLFLHGVCGVGKTHLLQGLARHVRMKNPSARVRYTTGERFANEYIASVQNRTIDAFRKRYRGVDLLCVDDVHFIAGKRGTQAEFLHTFATLDLDGARVVLASDEHPKQIGDLQEAIVSRCVSGMVVGLEKPDRATRRAICLRLAQRRGLVLDESAVEALASLDACSVRDLEGAVMHLEACVNLLPDVVRVQDGVVDGALVRKVLGARRVVKPNRPYRVDEILQASCEVIGVEVSEVLGPSRHRRVVIARSICAKLAKQLTTHSYPEIAKLMHRPNHSTIITAHKRIDEQIAGGERVGGGAAGVGEWTVLEACERVSERLRSAR
ncbi:MAG: AAA family ATPase [Phycisphaeraceae bacterium]|nr:MAG: AAA family ATPase [Phycisphaeraceae bacterium]